MEIRDGREWRLLSSSAKEYCRERFGLEPETVQMAMELVSNHPPWPHESHRPLSQARRPRPVRTRKPSYRVTWIWGKAADIARDRRIGAQEALRLASEEWRKSGFKPTHGLTAAED